MKKILLLILTVFPLALGYSQAMEIDIDTAIKLVKENNIDLKRATLELTGKQRDVKSAFNVFYPQIGGQAKVKRLNTKPEPRRNPLTQEVVYQADYTSLELGYSASFTFTPALFDAITLLKRDYEMGEITYSQTVADLEKQVKVIFYNVILLRENISLLEDNLKTIQARYELTKTNYEAGLVSELDLLQVQVTLENFKPEISNLKVMYNKTLLNFKMFMGLDFDQDITILGEIEPEIQALSYEDALSQAMANSKTLKLLNKSEQVLFAQKSTIFNKNFLPAITFEYSQATGLDDPFGNGIFDKDDYVDDQGNFSIGMAYNFTGLLPMSQERMEIDKIKRQIGDLNYQRQAAVDGIKLQVRSQIDTLNTSLSIQKGLELTVELAKKSLEKVEQAYKAGTVQVLEVEAAENEYKQARLNLLKEKFNYLNTWLELNSIISAE